MSAKTLTGQINPETKNQLVGLSKHLKKDELEKSFVEKLKNEKENSDKTPGIS